MTKPARRIYPFLHSGHVLIGFLRPMGSIETIQAIAEQRSDLLSVELMPRITRAQSMDALSSMATISGYKAALLLPTGCPVCFPC